MKPQLLGDRLVEHAKALADASPGDIEYWNTGEWVPWIEPAFTETSPPVWSNPLHHYRVKPPEPVVVLYVNVYESSIGNTHKTRYEADRVADTRIACVRVEYTSGQFDE